MQREQALELIERLPYLRTFQAPNDRTLEELFAEALAGDDPLEWVRVAKTCYLRRTDPSRKGKPLTPKLEQYATTAAEKLKAAFAATLQLETDKVKAFVQQHLAENTW